jgi:hypothetical protein
MNIRSVFKNCLSVEGVYQETRAGFISSSLFLPTSSLSLKNLLDLSSSLFFLFMQDLQDDLGGGEPNGTTAKKAWAYNKFINFNPSSISPHVQTLHQ